MKKFRRFRRGRKGKSLIAKVNKLAKAVKINKPELKWYWNGGNGTSVTTSGSLTSLNAGITNGSDDYGQRDGDRIFMKGLRDRVLISTNGAATPVVFRVIHFFYKYNPDTVVGAASIINLVLHSASILASRGTMAPYDHDNRGNVKVISDKLYTLNPQVGNAGTYLSCNKMLTFNLKLNAWAQYSADSSTLTKNELFRIVITDATAAYSQDWALYYTDA